MRGGSLLRQRAAPLLTKRAACGSASRCLGGAARGGSGSGSDDRELRQLSKAHSINSGVTMNHPGGVGAPENEAQALQQTQRVVKSLLSGDVHGSYKTKENVTHWRKRPLFKRSGKNLTFTSGQEAAELLVDEARRRDPYQVDFLQCVQEVSQDVCVTFEGAPKLAWVFKQLMEPERLVTFRVPWTDDNGNARINRGYRIQYSSALGPYHGGLRFHPHLSHGGVRMLGWEQTLKNALTGAPLGGSRGGSDFDPSNKSEHEIRRFANAFVCELADFIGPGLDTLETDLGVGSSVMAALHDAYRMMDMDGESDGSESLFGACEIFPEASGFGSVYFAERALEVRGESLQGKRCLISGAGELARSTALKLAEKGALPVTLSDDSGFIVNDNGFVAGELENIAHIKKSKGTLKEYARLANCQFYENGSQWEQVKGDLAFPSVIQSEINTDDATALADNGCLAVFENADRACTSNAQMVLNDRGLLFAPSKAVNCGSVIASTHVGKSKEEMDEALRSRMIQLHDEVADTASRYGATGDLQAGANLLAFIRIANSPMYTTDI